MSKPPRIPDSGNSLGPITAEFDSVSLLKGLLLIDDRSPAGAGHASVAEHGEADLPGASLTGEASNGDNGLAAEASVGGNSNTAEQAAAKIDDLISTRGITPTWAGDGGLKLTGLAEAAARIGIHLDSTAFDTQTADGFGSLQRVGLADSAQPASPDTTAGTSTTATATTLAINSALGADPIFETRVATAGDDVEEKGSGTISGNINDLELGYDGTTRQTVGIRFTSIDIPKGATITSAYIQFQANEVKTGAASLLIQGDNVDDANPFTTASLNVSSLPRTTASTAWTPAPWTT